MLHDSRCLFAAVLQRPRLNRKVSVELLCVFVGFRFRCQKAAELMTKQFANPIDKFFKLNMSAPRTTPTPDAVLLFLLPHRLQSAINHRPKWQCAVDYGLPAAWAAPVPATAPPTPSSVVYHSNRIKTKTAKSLLRVLVNFSKVEATSLTDQEAVPRLPGFSGRAP